MKIIHLSDLHFGTESEALVNGLVGAIASLKHDLVIVSGDFTQIGIDHEFKTARDFMANLPAPTFCVPGNHDVPHYNLWHRIISPYKKYQEYVIDNLSPLIENPQVIILGLNSARGILPHWNWANGALSGSQRQRVKEVFRAEEQRWKICVFHHPIHKQLETPLDVTVFGAKEMLSVIREQEVDLVLTGHVHHASLTTIGDEKHQTVYLSASTALSSRRRKQENGFNVITLLDSEMVIDMYKFDGRDFIARDNYRQRHF